MPMVPRLPRPKSKPMRETLKPNNDKQERLELVCESPRNNFATHTQNKDKKPEKVIDFEAEEGTKDIYFECMEPIMKLSEYIPPCKGKVKVTKDRELKKFVIHTPLFPVKITFQGLCLAQITLLKMEDWDPPNHQEFPHLAT